MQQKRGKNRQLDNHPAAEIKLKVSRKKVQLMAFVFGFSEFMNLQIRSVLELL
jgi:hypothetical protein